MKLVRLTYFSRATRTMTLADLKDILTIARTNNQKLGLCGMLCYDNQYFLQSLEGERETVNQLYLDIVDDPRHDDIVISQYEYIERPMFQDWQMGYAGSSPTFESLLNKLNLTQFEPDNIHPEQGLEILKQLAQHQDNI
ncbi:BLUF domain-containing protein [Algicola sagamiensis]|uniref:BLUF domain-containing protein n=1 Tax=Algicola sagamiensis TaxID=163869 RepID=UPI000381BBA8|nr:BLUF domain-containing protein [Algicola sagamiensis]